MVPGATATTPAKRQPVNCFHITPAERAKPSRAIHARQHSHRQLPHSRIFPWFLDTHDSSSSLAYTSLHYPTECTDTDQTAHRADNRCNHLVLYVPPPFETRKSARQIQNIFLFRA